MVSSTDVPDYELPSLTSLSATVPPDLDIKKVTQDWFTAFSNAVELKDPEAIINLLLPNSFWRDFLSLTWDFRTLCGHENILRFLQDQLPLMSMKNIRLKEEYLNLQQPYPDIVWINTLFNFETQVGLASGIVRLVPTQSGEWRAYVVFTNLEDLKGFPEQIGPLRNPLPNHGLWQHTRQRVSEFKDEDPKVVIVGGGQSGLDISARLKAVGVSALIIERNPRIGDSWRNRYEALCLHDPVCELIFDFSHCHSIYLRSLTLSSSGYDHMPYMPCVDLAFSSSG